MRSYFRFLPLLLFFTTGCFCFQSLSALSLTGKNSPEINNEEQKTQTSGKEKYENRANLPGDDSLSGKWVLEKIDGKPVEMPLSKDNPYMEIELGDSTISGYGGCNRFHGRAKLEEKKLLTKQIISTKMLCLDTQHIEDSFLGTLSAGRLEFSIEDSVLTLSNSKIHLTFKKAEKN